jgi:hypothetical protein
MEKAYEDRLKAILVGKQRASSGGGKPDLNAAGANLANQGI